MDLDNGWARIKLSRYFFLYSELAFVVAALAAYTMVQGWRSTVRAG